MSKQKTDIWMPFYIGDYLADTIGLSRSEHGSYILTICAYWRNGGPLSDRDFRKITVDDFDPISVFFELTSEGFYVHNRIEQELKKANSKKEIARENGRKGGNPNLKKGNKNPYYVQKDNLQVIQSVNQVDKQDDKQRDNQKISSSPSPSSSQEYTKLPSDLTKVNCSAVRASRTTPTTTKKTKTSEEYVEWLKKNPIYDHIDFARELSRMDAWLALPKNRTRQKTPQFILNWINKIERPISRENKQKPFQDFEENVSISKYFENKEAL